MPAWMKLLFVIVALGTTFPVILAMFQDTIRRDRKQQRPISDERMRKLWVVDREDP